MKKILWLPAWYPNKTNPLTGDFIQRHAAAVSLYHAVQVIHVLRDKDGTITKDIQEENFQRGSLGETIIYYYTPAHPFSLIDKFISNRRYRSLYKKAVKNYIDKEGIPACAHVHVIDKNVLVALWLKRKYKVSFVISEHWTGYLPEALINFKNTGWVFKAMWKKIISSSNGLTVVSRYLGEAIKQLQKSINYTVIPNVVDKNIFFTIEKKEETVTRFIHVSGLDYQKNPEDILQALALVKKSNPNFIVDVFGSIKKEIVDLANHLQLQDQVIFHNEVPQPQLAAYMQQSHALVLYSRYETFGCVLIEANACGIPAIVSDIPVFYETIEEGVNGYFVAGENPTALAEKIIWFIHQRKSIVDSKVAATTLERYNYERVGKLFSDFYTSSIKR